MLIDTVSWNDKGVRILDQTKLPVSEEYVILDTVNSVVNAIRELKVRGAPAIGITAAYGLRLAYAKTTGEPAGKRMADLENAAHQLIAARPTAVNLKWAVLRMLEEAKQSAGDVDRVLAKEADRIKDEDIYWNRQISIHGESLLKNGDRVLTHCNTGGLATGGYGTALGIVKMAVEKGKSIHVYVDETRPLLQGARLTAWELERARIPYEIICDSVAASLMQARKVSAVLVGADRIARNGDTANKIGTYGLAVLARYHNVPFYVAAPSSSIDKDMDTGNMIPIELRDAREVSQWGGRQIAPTGAKIYNPAFDVTPADLITAIITENGLFPKFTCKDDPFSQA